MNLYCCETAKRNEVKAQEDPILLTDKVLEELQRVEKYYHELSNSTTIPFPDEITSDMRKIVAEWMMEVCEEEKCQDEVFLLAMNYVNRFLLLCSIKKNQLQLLGTTCMLIASKLRQPNPLEMQQLIYYTDYSINAELLRKWELLVVSKLQWHLAAVTPHDFLPHLLKRLQQKKKNVRISYEMVNKHAKTLVALCARETKFNGYYPSVMACASIASALCGLGWTTKFHQRLGELFEILHEITSIEVDTINECFNQIELMVRTSTNCDSDCQGADYEDVIPTGHFTPPPDDKLSEHITAYTPTDVHDVDF